jgi:hypothetical protein
MPTVSEITAEAAARLRAASRLGTKEAKRIARIPATTKTSTKVKPVVDLFRFSRRAFSSASFVWGRMVEKFLIWKAHQILSR